MGVSELADEVPPWGPSEVGTISQHDANITIAGRAPNFGRFGGNSGLGAGGGRGQGRDKGPFRATIPQTNAGYSRNRPRILLCATALLAYLPPLASSS